MIDWDCVLQDKETEKRVWVVKRCDSGVAGDPWRWAVTLVEDEPTVANLVLIHNLKTERAKDQLYSALAEKGFERVRVNSGGATREISLVGDKLQAVS